MVPIDSIIPRFSDSGFTVILHSTYSSHSHGFCLRSGHRERGQEASIGDQLSVMRADSAAAVATSSDMDYVTNTYLHDAYPIADIIACVNAIGCRPRHSLGAWPIPLDEYCFPP